MNRLTALGIVLVVGLYGCSSTGSKGRESDEALAQMYADMGVAYLRRGDNERARDRLDRAIKLDPDSADVHHYMAELESRSGELKVAEYHFEEALRLRPQDPNIENNYGVFLCSQKRVGEAEKHFLAAINNRNYKTPHLAYENLGRCALEIPDAAQAETYFRQALRRQPKLPVSLFNMAKLQYDKDEYFKARAYFERYLEIGSVTPEVLWLGVRIENKSRDERMTAKYAEQLRKRFPESEEAAQLRKMEKDGALGPSTEQEKAQDGAVSDEVGGEGRGNNGQTQPTNGGGSRDNDTTD